ncbi:MAG TPA: rhomboid family intramembrane serine protease [Xanthobacteraceae bacterium]
MPIPSFDLAEVAEYTVGSICHSHHPPFDRAGEVTLLDNLINTMRGPDARSFTFGAIQLHSLTRTRNGRGCMAIYQNRLWLVERPHAVTFTLVGVNIFVFWLCLRYATTTAVSPDVLFLNGAMYPGAIERREYWRLIAYAFLHADLLHLASNMICLILWGGYLQKRVGSFYFLVIYFCAWLSAPLSAI